MEEWVGKLWHRWISRYADPYHRAAITLTSQQRRLQLLLRALSGDGGRLIRPALKRDSPVQRSGWRRLATRDSGLFLAWRDRDTLYLPPRMAIFPTAALNQELYLWLTALGSLPEEEPATATILVRHYPALVARQQRLMAAWRQSYGQDPPLPLQLAVPELPIAVIAPTRDREQSPPTPSPTDSLSESSAYHRAQRAELPEQQRGGILAFRLESLFTWTDYLPLNRSHDEGANPDAVRAAEDMQTLHLQPTTSPLSHRIRLDFDRPAAAYDDQPVGVGILLPEWDDRRQQLRPQYCTLQRFTAREATAEPLPARLYPYARKLRQQLAVLRHQPRWQSRHPEGGELDLEAYIRYRSEADRLTLPELYRQRTLQQRQMATLLLADLSLSTDSTVTAPIRVIEVIQDALLLFGETLHALGDRFALYGFSSLNRQQVRYHHLKAFSDRYDAAVRGRILASRPGYYTRMGAAIRYATQQLNQEAVPKRLLLLLTDGKPNDLDQYEGRYGLEDTRHAIQEARQHGVIPFCITIDSRAETYLTHLFGQQGWVWVRHTEELPQRLAYWYGRLTRV